MHDSILAAVGIISAVLNCCGTVPYVRDIFRHKTKPERAMWWVYAVLFSVLLVAQAGAGARWLLVVTGAYIASALLIALLSLRYGYGRFHRRDVVSLLVAAAGLLVWWRLDQPLVAIVVVIGIDFAGFWLTLVKTWHAPHSETLIAWQLSCVAALLSLFTVGSWSLAVLAYPVYAVLGGAFIVWLIMYRRTKVGTDPDDFQL
jgi:hypothetical protein